MSAALCTVRSGFLRSALRSLCAALFKEKPLVALTDTVWTCELHFCPLKISLLPFFFCFFLSEYELENNLKKRSDNVKSAPKACPETEADDVFDLVFLNLDFILFFYHPF